MVTLNAMPIADISSVVSNLRSDLKLTIAVPPGGSTSLVGKWAFTQGTGHSITVTLDISFKDPGPSQPSRIAIQLLGAHGPTDAGET